MEILKAYGVPKEIVAAIEVLYINTKARVISPDGDTNFFDIYAGMLQGDTLAPYLFIIALDYAMRIALKNNNAEEFGFTLVKSRSRRHPAVVITDADYADDIALLSDSIEKAELLLHRVEEAAKQIGLHINEDKTEFMAFNQPHAELQTTEEKPLKCTDDFVYLGSWIKSSKKDIDVRIGKAWTALRKLNIIWQSGLPMKLKLSFFHTTVTSVLLYGSSTWTLTKELEKRLNGCYTKMLRVVKNVTWQQHLDNNTLYGDLPKITTKIAMQRVMFAGHCWRSKEELIHKLILWDPSHGNRSRGRPARTYIDQLVSDTGLSKEDLPAAMDDRQYWKHKVMDVRLRSTRFGTKEFLKLGI